MRTRIDVFDNILTYTAQMGYPFEKPFFQNDLWYRAKTVADMGCGNAEYTSMLSKDYKEKNFIGVEKNPLISKRAYERHNKDNIKIRSTGYESLQKDFTFDFLIARRFILPIYNERQEFYSWLLKHASSSAGVLIIDTNIENFCFDASLPLFSKFYESIVNNLFAGSYSTIRDQVEKELTTLGMKCVSNQALVVNTILPDIKKIIYIYMRLSVELHLGSPIPSDLDNELFEWLIDPHTYAQFDMFGALFEIKKER